MGVADRDGDGSNNSLVILQMASDQCLGIRSKYRADGHDQAVWRDGSQNQRVESAAGPRHAPSRFGPQAPLF